MKTVKFILTFVVFFTVSHYCSAQKVTKSTVSKYMRSKGLKTKPHPYVSFSVSLGGTTKEYYHYYEKDGQFVLASFNFDSTEMAEKIYNKDQLFYLLEENMNSIIELRMKEAYVVDLHQRLKDKENVFTQIGIRYSSIFFNHFQQVGPDIIENEKNESLKKGYQLLDKIVSFFKTES
jgi:hypothetical protein